MAPQAASAAQAALIGRGAGRRDTRESRVAAVIEYIADRLAVMRAGSIVAKGACAYVLNRPQDSSTRTVLAAVPRMSGR